VRQQRRSFVLGEPVRIARAYRLNVEKTDMSPASLAHVRVHVETSSPKQAVAPMKKIDKKLGIEAELTSGIYDSPDGASVVIMPRIKTPLNWETLRYVAAVKEKALLEESPDQLSA